MVASSSARAAAMAAMSSVAAMSSAAASVLSSMPSSSLSATSSPKKIDGRGGRSDNALEDARRQKNQQYKMPHLTSVASRAAILDFEVPSCRIIAEIFAEILFVPVPKMKVSYLLDILVGGVCNIYELPVGEVRKKIPIGLPPLLCFGGCHGERGAELWLCCVYVCVLVNKNDDSTVSITNTGCFGCNN
jgi:hypothetical protein